MANSPASGGLGFGDPEKVFDETGSNASGRIMQSANFFALALLNMLLGFAVLATVSYQLRDATFIMESLWTFLGVVLGVMALMFLGSWWAIASQNWLISLLAYLGVVAAPFGVLFAPFVNALGARTLYPAIVATAVLMLASAVAGIIIKPYFYKTVFGESVGFALYAYLLISFFTLKLAASNTTVREVIAALGVVLFICLTMVDANRMKTIAHKDADNAVDAGMQLWLNSVNILLRMMTLFSSGKKN